MEPQQEAFNYSPWARFIDGLKGNRKTRGHEKVTWKLRSGLGIPAYATSHVPPVKDEPDDITRYEVAWSLYKKSDVRRKFREVSTGNLTLSPKS